ncbi:XdhC family protein [Psychrobacter sp. MES7-P7E]|uniref:XdhC family protein n=1 Tax=Psychrobacter sp. MES7-P7E TaxID=2058322 RepID=UPI000C7EC6D8|nr:XdhC family protein [Psychrobacter sp. MES7-P7E]PLT20862.1 xanthine dehydrogenase accessory protein XdhC [Psychrobacter sp. MES7-P7E]
MSESLAPPVIWYEGLARYQQRGVAHVLATVVAVNGSAPRALQAKMIVTQDGIVDTLGGGGLEHDVINTARQLLNGEIAATVSKEVKPKVAETDGESTLIPSKAVRRDAVYTKHYPLGAKLAQCCGGSVTVMFECFNVTPPMSVLVFGAGHVASALMTILAELPCQVDWVDSRPEMFKRYLVDESNTNQSTLYNLPAHIRPHIDDEPVDFVRPFIEQGGQRFILVMTHDHSVDFELVRAALDTISDTSSSDDQCSNTLIPYIGCIASATKAKRFRDRLMQRGYSEQLVNQLVMPIGLQIGGKEPMAVAVSIVAQLLQQYHQAIS